MMKLLVISAFVAFAAADVKHLFPLTPVQRPLARLPVAPAASGPAIRILRSDSNINPDGSYQYAYETENGIAAQEQGQQRQIGAESGNAAQGSFQWTSPEGIPVVVRYIADENGYQPISDVLPTSPPIPAAILRSLEYNAAHPEPEKATIIKARPVFPGFGPSFLG